MALAAAAPAHAVSVTSFTAIGYNGAEIGTVGIVAEPGEVNTLQVTGLPPHPDAAFYLDPTIAGSVLVRDATAPVTSATSDCRVLDTHTALCTLTRDGGAASLLAVDMQLGDRSDGLRIPTESSPLYLEGDSGAGNDQIRNFSNWMGDFGTGAGDDLVTVRGTGGGEGPLQASISTGAGDDVIDATNGGGEDIYCGDGTDTLLGDEWDPIYALACEDFSVGAPNAATLKHQIESLP